MKTRMRRRASTLVAAMLMTLVGCGGGSDQPALGTVTGVVTLDGEPLPSVEISFEPESGRPSNGKTDSEGKYELTYIRDTLGAKVGSHKVIIRSGQVDNSKLDSVEVFAGPNVIDIDCVARTGKQPAAVEEE